MKNPDFDEIYASFREPVLRYLSRLVSAEDAEGLAQETFVKVSRGLGGFKGESKLSTWIFRIATNTALDRLKRPARKAELRQDDELQHERLRSEALPVDKRLEQKQMSECVRGVMDELPPDYRIAIVLSEIDELTGPEMAEVLGVSVEAAKVRLHRARKKLKGLLDKRCDFVHDERNVLGCVPKPTVIKFRKN